MHKVLLINPAQTYYKKAFRQSDYGSVGLPLGLLYIAAVLEEKGCHVRIIDSLVSEHTKLQRLEGKARYGISLERIRSLIEEFRPDIVGINSQFTAQEENVFETAELVKSVDDSVLVIAGGANASCRGKHLLSNSNLDIVVKSEGEEIVREIIDFHRGRTNLEEIKGIIYREGNEIKETAAHSFIKVLDDIPFPAYHLVNMEDYLSLYKKGIYTRDRDVKRNISMVTSRGCPYGCIFCSIALSMGKAWRAHSPEYVSGHLEMLVKDHGVRHIHFEDDNLLVDTERFLKILDILKKYDLTWDTPNGIHVKPSIDESVLKKMSLSGCKSLTIGIESGDEQILKHVVKKKIKLSDAEEFAKRCKKVGLPLRAFFILGFPGETLETMEKTIGFALHLLKTYDVEIINLIATPLYGTELYELCERKKYFSEEITPRSLSESTISDGLCLIGTESFSSKDVERMSKFLTSKAYRIMFQKNIMHPLKMLRRVGNIYILKRTLNRMMRLH